MSHKGDDIVFTSLDQVALFTTKALKRIVRTMAFDGGVAAKPINHIVTVVERNLTRLQLDRKMYFATIRDYSRILFDEYMKSSSTYNSMLLVIALKLGIEKVWTHNVQCVSSEAEVSAIAAAVYLPDHPTFALKYLDETEELYDYFLKYSPKLEEIYLACSVNSKLSHLSQFKNLRILKLSGPISDKSICSGLWSVAGNKSDKILEMAFNKDPKSWQLSLPHLEELIYNVLTKGQDAVPSYPMKENVGAAAFIIQPKMKVVESVLYWGTLDAICHLLKMESKHKIKQKRKFEVTHLSLCYKTRQDWGILKQAVDYCPKVTSLELTHTKNIHEDISYLTTLFRADRITKLQLDARALTHLEFSVLVATMKNLEHLTLELTLESILNYNIPIPPMMLVEMKEEEYKKIHMFPPIKTLVIKFSSKQPDSNHHIPRMMNQKFKGNAESIIGFLSSFATVKEIYFRNTVMIDANFLVFGCFGGAIAVLHEPTHVSIIAYDEEIPRPIIAGGQMTNKHTAHIHSMNHFVEVQHLLPELQEDVTFKHMETLKSIEIDELYMSPVFDHVVKTLRLSGVHVSVRYRNTLHLPA